MSQSPLSADFRAGAEPVTHGADRVQVAALCLRASAEGPQVLLVTSRGTGRWILPKGWPMKGCSLAEAALREAWEEAGVQGRVAKAPVGDFAAEKVTDDGVALPCRVAVFRVEVEGLAAAYPEAGQRTRAWFAPSDAAERVTEPGLQALLRTI